MRSCARAFLASFAAFIATAVSLPAPSRGLESGSGIDSDIGLGYDLILVVDTTACNQGWFGQAAKGLEDFVALVRNPTVEGEARVPLRTGLLFFRDRKIVPDCDMGYLFRWEVDLTTDVESVVRALGAADEASCGSDEAAEAIYDALSRAVLDPAWADGHFKVVLLITDAPPHPPSNRLKNPLGLDVRSILALAAERNVRFLVFKVGSGDATELKALAVGASPAVQGRFRLVEVPLTRLREEVSAALTEEWVLLTKALRAFAGAQTAPQHP